MKQMPHQHTSRKSWSGLCARCDKPENCLTNLDRNFELIVVVASLLPNGTYMMGTREVDLLECSWASVVTQSISQRRRASAANSDREARVMVKRSW